MLRRLRVLSLLVAALGFAAALSAAETYVIDKNHSDASFQVRHFASKVRGRFADFAGTIQARCHGMQTDLEVESDAEDHLVAAVLRNAEQGCFARAAIEQPVAVTSSAKVNGRTVDFESYPRRVPRRQS